MSEFDYDSIPQGYYDHVAESGTAMRRFWHVQKFERVLNLLADGDGDRTLLDVGCFAGTFLAMVPESKFSRQIGVDILPAQIEYAREKYGSPTRSFEVMDGMLDISNMVEEVDAVTLIEVIEHLKAPDIQDFLEAVSGVLKPGGQLIITTPNYRSMWPLLELAINAVSDVSYEEQHYVKFVASTIEDRLSWIWPKFDEVFEVRRKTTSHFLSPFAAEVNFDLARRFSNWFHGATDRFYLGSLILLDLRKRA